MAATVFHSSIYNSYLPENVPRRQMEPHKTTQTIRPRTRQSNLLRRDQSQCLKRLHRPNNPSTKRALSSFVESGSMENALYLFEKMDHSDTSIWNVIIRGFTNNGLFREAVYFYYRMECEGVGTDNFTFPFVLKACGELSCLSEGEQVHAKLVKAGLDSDVYVCNFLIGMYFKLGLVQLSEKVFEGMCVRDLVSWNSMVSGYQSAGDGLSSLICFQEMLVSGMKPDRCSMVSVLGACSIEGFLQSGKEIHCQVIRSGLDLEIMVQTSLLDMYGKCGEVTYAERMFNRIYSKNIVTWNAMIGGYAANGCSFESLSGLKRMQMDDRIIPDAITMIKLLPSVENALYLFEKMDHSDAFIWNVIIRVFTNNGLFREAIDFYYRMECEGVETDNFTFPFVIKACGELLSLNEGEKVHAKLVKVGLDSDVYICNFLIVMYFKLGFIELAEKVFKGMRVRDLVSWNSMVSGYQSAGDGLSSLICFREMLDSGMKPDRYSMVSVLGSCSMEGLLHSGKEIHCHVIRSGLELDIMVQTSLLDMYGKCGEVTYAERMFNRIYSKNIVVWNAMLGGYAVNGCFFESFSGLRRMQRDDSIIPDAITMINLLASCSQFGALLEGKSLHGYAIRRMLLPHLFLETSLVEMYGACGKLKLAELVFSQINERNLVSWNVMISAYVQNGMHREAMKLFHDMRYKQHNPDAITFTSILPSYAEIASISECKQIHAYITKLELASNIVISNAIVYMYANCGALHTAREVFDGITCKNTISWNTIIMSYALHGFGKTSIQLFSEMRENGMKPNESTYVSLLSSCSISGLVEEGWEFFNSMKTECVPGIEHYGCMLDLLGRTGDLARAKQFVQDMPLAPTARIWGSLLTASRNKKDIAMVEFAAKHALSLEHNNTGCYVLLSNMYAEAGRWEDVDKIKLLMKTKGLVKQTVYSIVEIKSKDHIFINQDMSHPQTGTIYSVLDIILKNIGVDICIHSFNKFRPLDLIQKRAKSPQYHSLKLGICFGLISTAVGSPVIIRKNSRICEHCHYAAKKISLVTQRELIVGDSKIFHHFQHGRCSCGDYW